MSADGEIKTEAFIPINTTWSPTPAQTPKKKATPKRKALDDEDGTPSKRGRTSAAKIASSASELSIEDRMLLKWREDGKSWPDIDKAMEELTGKKPAASTLRKRYGRVKANIACVNEDDFEMLKAAVEKVKNDIEEEKKALDKKMWARVAETMVQDGATEKYEPGTLEKEWKKMLA